LIWWADSPDAWVASVRIGPLEQHQPDWNSPADVARQNKELDVAAHNNERPDAR
jgi:hypothetical protein